MKPVHHLTFLVLLLLCLAWLRLAAAAGQAQPLHQTVESGTLTPTTTITTTLSANAFLPVIYKMPSPTPTLTPTSTSTPLPTPTPTSVVVLSQKPAFDLCRLPSISQMQTWWTYSPYYTINLYLGGNNLVTCRSSNLTADWVSAVHSQGWIFIPTWVGPQAPCSPHNYYTMSDDPLLAYNEGRTEAEAALAVAASLGLTLSGTQGSVIYYDLEDFYPATTACRQTVKSFLEGWVTRLHELGSRAGVYGAGCNSYVSDWATLVHFPDYVWLAAYNAGFYDPNATVWNVACVSNSLWANHQRLRQYAATHNETWGSLTLAIDSNVADGAVVSPLVASTSDAALSAGVVLTSAGAPITAFQPVTASAGWVLSEGRLRWTADGGASWDDLAPINTVVLHAYFADVWRGWLVAVAADSFALSLTTDGGQSWQTQALPPLPAGDWRPLSLQFLDDQTGWIVFQRLSGSNFSLATMLATRDGGQTWQIAALPIAGQARFSDDQHGWIVGGATGSETFVTADGGITWLAASIEDIQSVVPTTLPEGTVANVFSDATHGWALAINGACQGDKRRGAWLCHQQITLWQTADGGETWTRLEGY